MVSFSIEKRHPSRTSNTGPIVPRGGGQLGEEQIMDEDANDVVLASNARNQNEDHQEQQTACQVLAENLKMARKSPQSPESSPAEQQQQSQVAKQTAISQSPPGPFHRQVYETLADDLESFDEEHVRRILQCKRLSEGCNNRFGSSFITRKNSLHMIEEMPPLTEGEPMRHMSMHLSQAGLGSGAGGNDSSGSSSSLRGRVVGAIVQKQASSTDCSSSTSLDRSPTRRRSSTCSSVLSETSRNQLNFDLEPDLPLDANITDTNAASSSPCPMMFTERPRSPIPTSASLSGDSMSSDFQSRAASRISCRNGGTCSGGDDSFPCPMSPDSTLGDSNELQREISSRNMMEERQLISDGDNAMESSEKTQLGNDLLGQEVSEALKMEELISDVSSVAVSTELDGKDAKVDSWTEQGNSANKLSQNLAVRTKILHSPSPTGTEPATRRLCCASDSEEQPRQTR